MATSLAMLKKKSRSTSDQHKVSKTHLVKPSVSSMKIN